MPSTPHSIINLWQLQLEKTELQQKIKQAQDLRKFMKDNVNKRDKHHKDEVITLSEN